ncbi:lanC-like protein 2 isoform X2 [Eurytemora carolleeae]|uniref:lanC-like protein 2 isoform X2 n=1 Tax=Eurytemora carolleeae TaxID=1294199 RepID=UPI000C771786|nr:lanC-like protein 2 isoform X2 [Eurytemora carolleeae]|eukprot:XP_023339953.1 lanC-like protein 2 isoform X2 [Eurytemora affinis]
MNMLQEAQQIIDKCLGTLKGKRVTFLCGNAGPLALAAVIYSVLGEQKKSQKYLNYLLEMVGLVDNQELPDEMLYGRSGYLFSLLFVRKEVGATSVPDCLIRKVVILILRSGQYLSRETRSRCPLMYEWHGKRYYGAAHGLSGIYTVLLQSQALNPQELRELVKPSIDYLLDKMFPSGNFPSSQGNDNDKLVHWCHGIPGVIYLLLLAYAQWKEEKYMNAAIKGGECIWERGLLRKGSGLCHGSAGNGYGLVHLYQATQDTKWLYRAAMFGLHCSQFKEYFHRLADSPLSLFEGLAGTVHYLFQLKNPESAKFPGFLV